MAPLGKVGSVHARSIVLLVRSVAVGSGTPSGLSVAVLTPTPVLFEHPAEVHTLAMMVYSVYGLSPATMTWLPGSKVPMFAPST